MKEYLLGLCGGRQKNSRVIGGVEGCVRGVLESAWKKSNRKSEKRGPKGWGCGVKFHVETAG